MRRTVLFHPDPPETPTGAPAPAPAKPLEKEEKPPATPAPSNPSAAPPMTAEAVIKGKKTERELELETDKRKLETRVAELEDDNRRLKTPQNPPQPPAREQKRHFLSGGTFFEDTE